MSSIIQNFDMLGVNPVIYYNSQRRKKSLIGGIASIITWILIFLVVLYYIAEIILKTSYSVIYNQMTASNQFLNLSNMPYAFGIFGENGMPIKNINKIFNLYGEFMKIQIINNVYQKENIRFDLEKCEKRHFDNYISLFENQEILQNFYCIPLDQHNLTLFGNFEDFLSSNSGLFIKINKYCNQQNTEESNLSEFCSNSKNIKKNSSELYINTIFIDYEIDHSNSLNPIKIILQSRIFNFSPNSFNEYKIKKRIVNYLSDEGYFVNNIKNFSFYQDDYIEHCTNLNNFYESENSLVSFSLSLSRKIDHYYRNYLKLQTALANIGGIAEGIFLIFSYILKYIMKNDYFYDLGILSYIISEETENIKQKNEIFSENPKCCKFSDKNFSLNFSRKRDITNKSNLCLKKNYINDNVNESNNNINNNILTKNLVFSKDLIKKSRRKSIEIRKNVIEKTYFHFLPCLKKSKKKINELLEIIIKKDLSVESLIRLINSQEFLNYSLIEKNVNDFQFHYKNLNRKDNLLKTQILNKLHNEEEIIKIKTFKKY